MVSWMAWSWNVSTYRTKVNVITTLYQQRWTPNRRLVRLNKEPGVFILTVRVKPDSSRIKITVKFTNIKCAGFFFLKKFFFKFSTSSIIFFSIFKNMFNEWIWVVALEEMMSPIFFFCKNRYFYGSNLLLSNFLPFMSDEAAGGGGGLS